MCFENQGGVSASMTSWRVKDEYGWTYKFPSLSLAAGARVKLHTGAGVNSASDLYWGRTAYVWNNSSDTVYLYDAAEVLVDSYHYP